MNFFDEITDPTRSLNYLDQGSEAWEKIRVGRFTSSEIHKLMGDAKRDMTPEELKTREKGSKAKLISDPSLLSEGAMTYIKQKAFEVMTGTPKPQHYVYAMGHGQETEPLAVEEFERITGWTCEKTGFQVYTDHAGGSPDRLIPEMKAGLEVKCPVFEEQVDYELLTDAYTLKLMYPNWYYQCASLMLFHDLPNWYFATYGWLLPEGRKMKKENIIHISNTSQMVRDDQDLIIKKIELAVKEKLALLKLLNP